jgi:hypothetical protein
MESDRFKADELVFVRARVVRHGSTYEPGKQHGLHALWLLQPVDASGRDVNGASPVWATPETVVSAREAREIIKGGKR